ncbi:glycosyltransferase family protein [Salipiger aestuarii]|uniref:glycosyltransferase n=1 Tax=Salipiger aestuarii TaxID=568098 RepID=UPI001239838D|nr:glycosyltransferase [Salipiger aestuarii]KAA8607353.1 hypothetical protein AL037_18955 [Salipiger aestuarii]
MTKLFVIDPVCAQQLGHNLAAMRYFISSIRQSGRFERVEGVCAQTLADVVAGEDIHPLFKFNYHNIFNIAPVQPLDATNVQSDRDYVLRSIADFRRLFRDLPVDADTVLFFPSADYYGIMGGLMALKDLPVAEAPRVILRMIGVLENSSRTPDGAAEAVNGLMREVIAAGYPVEVLAETPAYASHLAVALDTQIKVAPYPVIDDLLPITKDDPLLIASLGSGRYDKGFLRLKSIFHKVIEKSEGLPLRFVVQNLPHAAAKPFVKYIAELSAIPGLTLASDVVTQHELSSYLRRARVIVTPYAQDVYALRGSAMLMEALSVGRPNVSEAGCGFSSQIGFYDCGILCQSDDDYADAILTYARMEVDELNARMAQARARFVLDSDNIYASLWT